MAIDPVHFPVIKFVIQALFSFSVAGFAMGMLITGQPVEIYLPVLTGVLGYWLPQPSLKDKRRQENSTQQQVLIKVELEFHQLVLLVRPVEVQRLESERCVRDDVLGRGAGLSNFSKGDISTDAAIRGLVDGIEEFNLKVLGANIKQ